MVYELLSKYYYDNVEYQKIQERCSQAYILVIKTIEEVDEDEIVDEEKDEEYNTYREKRKKKKKKWSNDK